jgi:hypothetical protein
VLKSSETLGVDFDCLQGTTVRALGVFCPETLAGDAILRCQIWDRRARRPVGPALEFTPARPGEPVGNARYKALGELLTVRAAQGGVKRP